MSIRKVVNVLSILKPTVEPRFTLMSVAKPWIEVLPTPETSHSLAGLPSFVFSQATSLTTGASHAAAAARGGGTTTSSTAAKLRQSTPVQQARHRRDERAYLDSAAMSALPR